MLVLHRVLAALSFCFLLNGATLCVAVGAPLRTPTPTVRHRAPAPEELYSRRALRRARLIIELRMLQLRKERLECVRRAIIRNLPPELRPPGSAAEGNRPPHPETCANLFL